MLHPDYASLLNDLEGSVAGLIRREGPGPAKLLELAVQVVIHGSDAQVDRLLTVASHVEQLWSDREVEWPAGDSPAQQVDRLLRVLVTKLRNTSPELVPAPLPGEYGATVESRSDWLGDSALAWQGSVPSGPFGPAGNSEHCRLHVMLVDPRDGGRVAQLTLYRIHRPHANLGFVAAPTSAFTPCTKSFAMSLGSASACLRRYVAGTDVRDTAIAWDIAPLRGTVMSALDGPSAGAALTAGAAWLMRASVTDAGLRGDLHRIGRADLVDAPITATIDFSGELGEVAGVLLKAEALRPYLTARKRSVFLHISSRQLDVDAADLRDAGVDVQRFGNLVELIRLVAERSLEMTPAQRQLLEALLRGDPDDDQVQVDPATVRAVANTDPVRNLVQYALHRWAWWARELEGQLHVRFVPLAIEPDALELPPDLAGLAGKFKGLADLLAQEDTGNLHGLMLRGQPGAGKSTLLKHFEQTLCRRALQAWSRGEPMAELPLYLPLAGLPPEVQPHQWVLKIIGERYPLCDELRGLLDPARRRDGRVQRLRCMLDGLNELPVRSADQRRERAREVARDIWHRLQPGLPMLLGARTHHGFDFRRGGAGMDIVPVDLLPWTNDDIQAYLERRFPSAEAAAHWLRLQDHAQTLSMCRVPINLAGQCDLLADGITRLATDRADLYRRWLWQRLQRELRGSADHRVDQVFLDARLLTPDAREALLDPRALQQPDMPPWPRGGALLPSLFRQGLAQWRQAPAVRPGVPAGARGEVEVYWDGDEKAEPGSDSALGVVHWLDEELRGLWLSAVQALGLAEVSHDRRKFKWQHQSWGEYLASVDLLQTDRERLFQELQPPLLERRDVDELNYLQQQAIERWSRVDPAFWEELLAEGITLPRDQVREALRAAGWGDVQLGQGGDWDSARENGAILDLPHRNLVRVIVVPFARLHGVEAAVGRGDAKPIAQRPEFWQYLVLEKLWPPFRDEVLRRLEPHHPRSELGLARLAPQQPGDLDEVLGLALLGNSHAEQWLFELLSQQLWQGLASVLPTLARRLETATPTSSVLQASPHPLLQHLRRVLLLRSCDAGDSARERVRAAGITTALDQPLAGLPKVLQTQWSEELACAFQGDGRDVRERLRAAEMLGQLGDNLRFEQLRVVLEDGTTRSGLRLRRPHWIGLGCRGEVRSYSIGSDTSDYMAFPDEVPAFSVTLEYFEMAAFPVTVGEWQAFVDAGGYDDADAPWWRSAGEAAQLWLKAQTDLGISAAKCKSNPEVARRASPIQPMTGVTVHEAAAYVQWAAPLYREWDDGLQLVLPTEGMWEAGVRGPSRPALAPGRWPDECDTQRPPPLAFNHADTRLGRPSPVGIFSAGGMTAHGVADAAGNVWEWCTNSLDTQAWRAAYCSETSRERAMKPADERDGTTPRALRGGAYAAPASFCRAACRSSGHPAEASPDVGFRLVRAKR